MVGGRKEGGEQTRGLTNSIAGGIRARAGGEQEPTLPAAALPVLKASVRVEVERMISYPF